MSVHKDQKDAAVPAGFNSFGFLQRKNRMQMRKYFIEHSTIIK
jgi:hypothetical protein